MPIFILVGLRVPGRRVIAYHVAFRQTGSELAHFLSFGGREQSHERDFSMSGATCAPEVLCIMPFCPFCTPHARHGWVSSVSDVRALVPGSRGVLKSWCWAPKG